MAKLKVTCNHQEDPWCVDRQIKSWLVQRWAVANALDLSHACESMAHGLARSEVSIIGLPELKVLGALVQGWARLETV